MAEPFGSLLRRFRARSGLNLSELAEALGASRMSIRAWEQGKRVPRDRARLEDLAQVLRLTHAEADQLAAAARQQRHPSVEAELPAAMPADPAMRHQLRAPIADFVGRVLKVESLVAAVQAALASGAGAIISSMQGMGGVGKTELAYVVAHHVRDAFPDAQILLNLRGTSATPLRVEQALQTVIRAFLPDAPLPDELEGLQARYLAVLHNQRVLILADDARDAAQVRPLIPSSGSALLITSRQRFSLPGMAIVDLEHLCEQEAVMLVQTICPFLRVAEALAIARACGYLPLAVRVSGGILRNDPSMAITDYIQRLSDERQRLVHLRDPDDAQLDVATSLALSYALLDTEAQQVFRQLGVLVADFDTALALAVVETAAGVDVTGALHELLRRNLLMYERERARWRLHDLVRDLARRYLEDAGEQEATSLRYAQAAVQIAQATHEQFDAGGAGAVVALVRFDAERPHIDAARTWAAEHAGTSACDALLVADAIATYYTGSLRYDRRREILPQHETALKAARRSGALASQGLLLNQLGYVYLALGDVSQAIPALEQALTIARTSGDRCHEGKAFCNLGNAYLQLGDIGRAITCYEHYLASTRACEDRGGEGTALGNLGTAYVELGQAQRALAALEQCLTIMREIGDRWREARALASLGVTYMDLGDTPRAVACHEQACAIARTLEDRHTEGIALRYLAVAYLDLGDVRRTIACCTRALTLLRAMGDQRQEGHALHALGAGYAAQGDLARATAAFEQALICFRTVGDRHGEAECLWHYGLALARQEEGQQALPLLRAAVAYEREIGHAKMAEHAALLVRMEAGEELPEKVSGLTTSWAVF